MAHENEHQGEDPKEGLPPLIKSWQQMYLIVFGNLVLLILIFYWFTRYFS
jgi:hypothetical protein